LANILRIISTAFIGEQFGGETATAFFEHFSGFLFFGMAFFLMIRLAKALDCSFDFTKRGDILRREESRTCRWLVESASAREEPVLNKAKGWKERMAGWMGGMEEWKIGRACTEQSEVVEAKESFKYRERNAREEKRYLHMATFVLLVIALTASFAVHEPTSQGELLNLSIFQTGLPGWQMREIKQEIAWPGEKVVWQDLIKIGSPRGDIITDNPAIVNLFVRYATNERARHSPERCSVAGGWTPIETKQYNIHLSVERAVATGGFVSPQITKPRLVEMAVKPTASNEHTFPANLMTLIRGRERMVALYWFVRDNRVITGSIEYYLATVWRIWLTGSSKGIYVQLSTLCTEASQEATAKLLMELAPLIQRKVGEIKGTDDAP
jgi:hypothetical protein